MKDIFDCRFLIFDWGTIANRQSKIANPLPLRSLRLCGEVLIINGPSYAGVA